MHASECTDTTQQSISDLRFARTRSARRPGSAARAAAALYATFASAILALGRARRLIQVPPRRRRSYNNPWAREARRGSQKIVRGSLRPGSIDDVEAAIERSGAKKGTH